MAAIGELLKKPSVGLKIVELLFGVISIAVVIDGYPVALTYPKIATIYGTQIGFVMIGMIIIMSYLMETPLHKSILITVSGIGAVMWITAGALIIDFYVAYSIVLEVRLAVSGAFAIINGVLYLVDAALSFKS